MEKKLPGVFANKVNGKAGNNEDVYYSHGTTEKNEDRNSREFHGLGQLGTGLFCPNLINYRITLIKKLGCNYSGDMNKYFK